LNQNLFFEIGSSFLKGEDILDIKVIDAEDEKIVKEILAGLRQYDYSRVEKDMTPLIISVTEKGKLKAGAQCLVLWDWIHVKLLWVDETYRKTGIGTRIMETIENEAVKRNCFGVHLDTYEFQAPDFYQKLGYVIFGIIEDHPKGMKRYYLSKRLKK